MKFMWLNYVLADNDTNAILQKILFVTAVVRWKQVLPTLGHCQQNIFYETVAYFFPKNCKTPMLVMRA